MLLETNKKISLLNFSTKILGGILYIIPFNYLEDL